MESTPHLLSRFSNVIAHLSPAELDQPQNVTALKLDRCSVGKREVEMIYAPFDHVNRRARIAIVGLTPGHFQAANALAAAQRELKSGRSVEQAAEEAKVFASFSGEPMRGNLIRMLDLIGVAKVLGLQTTASLWDGASSLVHFTSALRYPVFVDGANWSGQPDMLRTPQMCHWLEAYTGTELALLKESVIVPLGPKVTAAMHHLAANGKICATRILDGLPHPSGANAERIAFFMGDKPADLCSSKTSTVSLEAARERLCSKVYRLQSVCV